jgi:trehalose synthase-fused probable maltokinase
MATSHTLPTLVVSDNWDWQRALEGTTRPVLAAAIAQAIGARRWFGAKTRVIERLEIVDAVAISAAARILLVRCHFATGPAEVYHVPLGFAARERDTSLIRVQSRDGRPVGVLYDALADVEFCGELLELFESPRTLAGEAGEVVVRRTSRYDALRGAPRDSLAATPVRAEQSNSSVIYGQRLILKAFRRVETGLNPDFEISEFLSRQGFASTPPLAGWLEYQPAGEEPWALAMLQAFVANRGDAWSFTSAWLDDAVTRFAELPGAPGEVPPLPPDGLVRATEQPMPPAARAAFGNYLARAELLGKRTAQMHVALASDTSDPAFAPESFSEADRRAFVDRAREEARETFRLWDEQSPRLAGRTAIGTDLRREIEQAALARFARLADAPARVSKIRCHGDYHLGQVLVTDGDFVIVDFEGEPARPLTERRKKQLALRDVAGMIRSLHYASCAAATGSASADERAAWMRAWYAWTSVAFLSSYRRAAADGVFLPASLDEFERLLDACLLEKALYELRYELNNRPDWVHLPLAALEDLLS